MIYVTRKGDSFDPENDLSSPERHILQKLFIWQEMAATVEEFRRKKQEALLNGWNNSGPIQESPALKAITMDLEENVRLRLRVAR